MIKDIQIRFFDEVKTINAYVEYIENNFYSRSCSVSEDFYDLRFIRGYCFKTQDRNEKQKNKEIIDKVKEIIDYKLNELSCKLVGMSPVPLPLISNNIVEKDLTVDVKISIRCMIIDKQDNPKNLPYDEFLNSLSPSQIKIKKDNTPDLWEGLSMKQNYEDLTENDYESVLKYLKCEMYNEEMTLKNY